MIKLVVMMKRHADLSLPAFIARYEGRHAPLAKAHVSKAVRYERRYLTPLVAGDGTEIDGFDVLTELWYSDRESMAADLRHMGSADVSSIIEQDEEGLFDRATRRTYMVVQECADENS